MTPAEKRVKELIDRWLTSLDLHLQYVELKDSAYNNVQPWPVHDRPTRWILELAKQKALEMQAAFESRLAMGDSKFADTVELMVFLSTLVGIQHVQRYIPLADPDRHGQGTLTEADGLKPVVKDAPAPAVNPAKSAAAITHAATANAPSIKSESGTMTGTTTIQATAIMPPRTPLPKPAPPVQPAARPNTDDVTREMLQPNRAPIAPAKKLQVATQPKPVAGKIAAPMSPAAKPAAATTIEAASETHNLVINDAVRLLNWGKPWHELAELIARIADRPKLPEVRRILRSHRPAIEMRAADAQPEDEG